MASRSQRYYRKKAEQAIKGVLESIAPGNVSWLYQQIIQRPTRLQAAESIVEVTLVGRLVILYEEAAYCYTRQQILSLFVTDYSKTELLNLIPGLSKWRIDEARKHAFQSKPGLPIDPPRITRCRLDAAIFKSGNGECENGNGEWGTGNGESLKAGIFKSGNL